MNLHAKLRTLADGVGASQLGLFYFVGSLASGRQRSDDCLGDPWVGDSGYLIGWTLVMWFHLNA